MADAWERLARAPRSFVERAMHVASYWRDLRQDDVMLASFPRSGNTWVSFLIANALLRASGDPREVTFFNIHEFVPEIGAKLRLAEPLEGFPRFVKTHDGQSRWFARAVVLTRHPEAVMRSYYAYRLELGHIDVDTAPGAFLRHPDYGVDAWCAHTRSWLRRATRGHAVQMVRFEDVQAQPANELAHVFRLIGRPVSSTILEEAVAASGRDEMRELEGWSRRSRFVLDDIGFEFVSPGARDVSFSESDLSWLAAQTRELRAALDYPMPAFDD